MLKHVITSAAVVVCSVVITLVVARCGHDVAKAPPPNQGNQDLNAAGLAYMQCDEVLRSLNSTLADALTDETHRADRFSQALRGAQEKCTRAETEIRVAIEKHPSNSKLAKLREQNALGQGWLRDLSTAFGRYEAAAQSGSAKDELAALQALLQ